MAKVNVGRQGFLTKSALPTVTRQRLIPAQLLLLGQGANGSTTFTDSSANNIQFTRITNGTSNPIISTAQAPTGMSSSIFFGSATPIGGLRASGTTYSGPGTGNFTYEGWIYSTTNTGGSSGEKSIFRFFGGSPTLWTILMTNNRIGYYDTTQNVLQLSAAADAVPINTWTYFAIVRNGTATNNCTIYVNGRVSSQFTNNTNLASWSSLDVNETTGYQFTGYFSNMRYTPAALYNGNFTPPALPLSVNQTPVFALSALLNANETTDNTSNTNVVDSSSYNWTINYQAGMPSQTQATPFTAGTGGSMFFNGRSDYVTVSNPNNDAAFAFGTGDFTIEFWINTPAISTGQNIYDGRAGNNNGSQVVPVIGLSGSALFYFVSNVIRITSGTLANNTWYHVAIVRISGSTRMYVNGVQAGSTYADSNNYVSGADRPVIGISSFATTINQWETQANTQAYRGFVSNVRLVKGVGVYTGAFTPPTGPLTATQSAGTNIAAITGTQTSLLLNFDSNMRVMDSSTANPKGLAPNGINFAPIGGQVNFHPYSGGGKYGSYWFDGTYSFIDSPDSADWQITGDMTVEVWIYPTSIGGATRRIVNQNQDGSAANTSFNLALNGSGTITFDFFQSSSGTAITSSTTVSANTWTHIAVVRSGTAVTMYLNGVSRATGTFSGSTNNSTYPLRIGALPTTNIPANTVNGLVASTTVGGPIQNFAGYITGVRIVKGTAVYTGAFTPPSIQPVDVDGASSAASYPSTTNVNTTFSSTDTKLLCKFDRWTVVDNATLPRPVYLLGTAQTSTAQAKFGAASLTGGSSLSTTSNVYLAQGLNFGTGDFTISCWLYANAWNAPNSQNPICTIGVQNSNTSSSNTYYVYITNAGAVSIERFGGATTTIGNITPGSYTNTWFYFTLVRRSGTTTCYIDGTSIGSTSALSGLTVGNQSGIVVGRYLYGAVGTGTYTMWNGFIDDFNVAAFALYSTNFTPPAVQATDPYPVTPTVTNSVYGAYQNY